MFLQNTIEVGRRYKHFTQIKTSEKQNLGRVKKTVVKPRNQKEFSGVEKE
jgi:hypothetical protein